MIRLYGVLLRNAEAIGITAFFFNKLHGYLSRLLRRQDAVTQTREERRKKRSEHNEKDVNLYPLYLIFSAMTKAVTQQSAEQSAGQQRPAHQSAGVQGAVKIPEFQGVEGDHTEHSQ